VGQIYFSVSTEKLGQIPVGVDTSMLEGSSLILIVGFKRRTPGYLGRVRLRDALRG